MTRKMPSLIEAGVMFVILFLSSATYAADDGQTLIGDWKVISITDHGQKSDVAGMIFSFDKDKLTESAQGMKISMPMKLTPAKSPQQLDLTTPGPDKGTYLRPGIYKVEGDKLTLCFATLSATERKVVVGGKPTSDSKGSLTVKVGERPPAFVDTAGMLFILGRVKK